jgi:heme exporter protein B
LLLPSFLRELRIMLRRPEAVLHPLAFVWLVALMFGIALGPTPNRMIAVGPAVLMVTVLLAQLLAAEGLLAEDERDGLIDQWLTTGGSLSAILYGKVLARTAALLVPLLASAPLLAAMFRLEAELVPQLLIVLPLLTLATALVGLAGTALTVRVGRGGMLLALLVLPLNVPLLLFALGTLEAGRTGDPVQGPLLWLAAQTVGLLTLAPPAAAIALRASSD